MKPEERPPFTYMKVFAENEKTVGVMYGDNPMEGPAGFGPTLAAALRDFAQELEKYHCDGTPQDLMNPEKFKEDCFRAHDKVLHRPERGKGRSDAPTKG